MFYFLHFVKNLEIKPSIDLEYEIYRPDMPIIEGYKENRLEKKESVLTNTDIKRFKRLCNAYLKMRYKVYNKNYYNQKKEGMEDIFKSR